MDLTNLYILDYSNGRVVYYVVEDGLQSEEYEEIIREKGFRLKDINWMVSTQEMERGF